MTSLSSPAVLEEKSQCNDNPCSFPTTPLKILDEATSPKCPNGPAPETPTPSLRERRGRRNITNSSFRPLSVFTKSLLLPFDLDVERGFEILKGDSPDRLKEAGLALSPDHERLKMTLNEQCGRTSSTSSETASRTSSANSTEDPFEVRQNAEMDLMTALKVTSPEKDVGQNICADFAILGELPAPDYSQHPAFATDPFKTSSEAPLLSTLTAVSEIKWYNAKMRRSGESSTQFGKDSLERKRSFFGLEIKTPASAKSRNAFSAPGGPSSSSFSTNSTVSSPPKSASFASASVSEIFVNKADSTTGGNSTRSRKFSDRFKSKASSEQSESVWSSWSPTSPNESPNLSRQDLERYVRRTTNTPTYDYDPSDPYPRHPNTGRGWKSRNLKCTTCIDEGCGCCGRTCCAYRAAVLALEIRLEGTSGRIQAQHRIQEITKLYPYGKEVPTFLRCTAGLVGDGMGCGKLVCPDCCSICPDDACGDTQCRKCKPGMWEECTWHRGISFL